MNDIYSAFIILAAFIFASYIFDRALNKISQHFDANSSEVFKLLTNSQKTILIFIGVVLALSRLGFDVSALVAGLGLTGFAVGFALKDAISNLAAGILIVLYKPIELGDTVEIAGVDGEVVDLNLRYISIKSEDKMHLVPNSLCLNNKLTLFSQKK